MPAFIIPLLVQLIPSLVHAVEGIFTGAKQGSIKKTAVMSAVGSVFDYVSTVDPNFANYRLVCYGAASNLIDGLVSVYNSTGVWGVPIHFEGTGNPPPGVKP